MAPLPRPKPCLKCKTPTTNSFRWCDTCAHSHLVADCARQGVPPVIDDPLVYQRLGVLLTDWSAKEAS